MTKRKILPADNLDFLEGRLAVTLKPIATPRDVARRLRARLRLPTRNEIALRLSDWRRLFFVFGGVMTGALLLITIARAFYYLASRKG